MRQLFISVLIFIWITGYSQGFDQRIYDSYVSGDMTDWYKVISEMESVWQVTGSYGILYDQVVAYYGYIAYCINEKMDREAREYVKIAEEKLDLLLKQDPDWARAHAFLGAIYGYKVGLNPIKAIVYGKRAFDENNTAFDLAPDDPQVLMERANIEFYKPVIFGSNSREAASLYSKSIAAYEKATESLKYNWMYLNAMISLADAYIASDMLKEANETYKKILRIEPDMKWIKEEVYPSFRKKYGF